MSSLLLVLLTVTAIPTSITLPMLRSYRKVVVDVDAGTDDAMALMMMLSKESSVNIIAITCVTGNTGIKNVTKNVLKTLDAAERLDIPVFAGSPQGLVYSEVTDSFWGEDGFGDFSANDSVDLSMIRGDHAAIALTRIVNMYPGEVTVLALGPLTNIALAGHINNNFFKNMKNMVILGGSYQGNGNVKPGVEFNFYADPEAAEYVFSRALPEYGITIVPMEPVERAAFPMDFRKNVLGALNSTAIEFLNKAESKALPKMGDKWLCFDPTAAAVVLKPDIVENSIKRSIHVETHGSLARGAVLIDHKSKFQPITIVTEVNNEKLKALLLRNLA